MKNRIYWFSGTGNSLAIARDLAGRLDGSELIPLAEAAPLADGETVGLVFPVYSFGLPDIVQQFVRRADNWNALYTYAVATYAAAGTPHAQLDRMLRERGGRLHAGFSLKMPNVYSVAFRVPKAPRRTRMLQSATERTVAVAAAVQSQTPNVFEDTSLLKWVAPIINRRAVQHFLRADKHFHARENCTHCGLCKDICPVGNIALVNGLPQWQHHCQRCLACLHWCPAEAVQYGRWTAGKERYHHPAIKAGDLMP